MEILQYKLYPEGGQVLEDKFDRRNVFSDTFFFETIYSFLKKFKPNLLKNF